MEYSHGHMEIYIKDNSTIVNKKVMDTGGGQIAPSITDSSKMIRSTEKEFIKREANYTKSNMKKASVSPKQNNEFY